MTTSMKLKFAPTIFHKLLATLLAVSILPLSALWFLSQQNVESELQGSITRNMMSVVDKVARRITDWEDTNQRALRETASLNDIISMDPKRQNPILAALGSSYEWSYLVFTVAPDGQSVGRNDGGPVMDFSKRGYVKQVMSGKSIGREVVIGKTSGKPALILAAPIRNAEHQLVGTIAMSSSLEDVSREVAAIHVGDTGHAVLIDADNKIIAAGDASKVKGELQAFTSPALAIKDITEHPVVYTDNGRKMVGMMRQLPQGWRILIEQDYDEAYAPLTASKKEARILIVAAFALVFIAALMLGGQLSRPIVELTAIADEMSMGRLDVDIADEARADEIGALARSIGRLGISMRMAINRVRKQA